MKHGEEHVQRWILTFILTPTRFKWLCLYPNEDISLPFQYIFRIWEEVRLSDLNLGVTGTLLSFVGTLLFSHVPWHHEGKGEVEEGERNHRKIDRVQLWETRKKNQWEESGPFLPHWFSLLQSPACFIIIGHTSFSSDSFFLVVGVLQSKLWCFALSWFLAISKCDTLPECTVSTWKS